jgi:hypothetical protein
MDEWWGQKLKWEVKTFYKKKYSLFLERREKLVA